MRFTDDALSEIAEIAYYINETQDNTGARRLVSVLNSITEEINYNAPEIYEKYNQEGKNLILTIGKN